MTLWPLSAAGLPFSADMALAGVSGWYKAVDRQATTEQGEAGTLKTHKGF